jgi:hypothetical protein
MVGPSVLMFLPQAMAPFRIRVQNIKEAWSPVSSECLPCRKSRSQTVLFDSTANQLFTLGNKAG